MAKVEYDLTLLGAFLRCGWYGLNERLAHLRISSGCGGEDALLHAPLDSIKRWYALGICRLIQNKAVNSALASVAIGRLTKID